MRSVMGLVDEDRGGRVCGTPVRTWPLMCGRLFATWWVLTSLAFASRASAIQAQSAADSGGSVHAGTAPALTTDSIGSLTGRVIQGDGTPVVGAVVSVLGGSDSVLTTNDGRFALHGVPFGAHLVSVRRIGFDVKRFAMTFASRDVADVTVTLTRFVPILPTVTTTAEQRAAYHTVGLDRRMQLGVGQFLTYDQIVRKNAGKFTDLLRDMRGLVVFEDPQRSGTMITSTRGPGSCVSYAIDGIPQRLLPESGVNSSLGPESPDNLINPSEVGAIEVYTSAARPPGMTEPPPLGEDPSTQATDRMFRLKSFTNAQQCVLVMIWTRARLGLTGTSAPSASASSATSAGTTGSDVTRGVTTFALDSTCVPPKAIDTTTLVIYATVQGPRRGQMSDSAWSDYKARVLAAIDHWAALPSDLFLPSFSLSRSQQERAGNGPGDESAESGVNPSLSTVVAFTLDSAGALTSARVAASSLSDGADTAVLVMVEATAAARAFPQLPPGVPSAQLDLLVESAEPVPGVRAATIGQLEVPTWHLSHAARLANDRTGTASRITKDSAPGERLTAMLVVDATGHAVPNTVRFFGGTGFRSVDQTVKAEAWLLRALPDMQFEPARIGACHVNEFLLQSFTTPP